MTMLELAQIVGGFATAAGVLLALVTALVILAQTRAGSETSAIELYSGLMKHSIAFKDYMPPDMTKVRADYGEYRKYKRYIAYLFTVCEHVLVVSGNKAHWRETIEFIVSQQAEHVMSDDFKVNHYPHYSRRMQKVFDRVEEQAALAAVVDTEAATAD